MTRTLLPDPEALTIDQQQGWACALCGARLYEDRLIGTVSMPTGYPERTEEVDLWACSPECQPRAGAQGGAS
ncbi:hypothetical protein [Streptomyces sp. NBC_00212]|uniref:hypothetical protein n=1 Tax=Streptomyces sp. NBC_00212 TaxID=2975684 RepID=UPI003243D232